MPICKHCDALIKPLGIPCVAYERNLLEALALILEACVEEINAYGRGELEPNHPLPAVRRVVEFCPVAEILPDFDALGNWNRQVGMSIVVWEPPCNAVKIWQ